MREGGSGRDRELGVIRYNLEQIYKQILLSSIGELCLDTHIATEPRVAKNCIHVRVTCSPCCTVEEKI